MDAVVLLITLASVIVIAYFCHRIAERKARNGRVWAFLGALLGLIALAIIAVLPPSRPAPEIEAR